MTTPEYNAARRQIELHLRMKRFEWWCNFACAFVGGLGIVLIGIWWGM